MLTWLMTAVVFLFSLFGLIIPNFANAALFTLFLSGLVIIFTRRSASGVAGSSFYRQGLPLFFAMATAMLAVFIHQAATQSFRFAEYDRPIRLAMFFFVFISVFLIPLRQLQRLQWVWIAAVLLMFLKAWVITDGGALPNSGSLGFMAGIAFSNMALLTGMWILLSLGWSKGRWSTALKLLAFVLALYVTFMVKTRGTWLALPFFAIFLVLFLRNLKWRYKLTIILFPLVLLSFGVVGNEAVKKRIFDVKTELIAYQDGTNRDTSIGQRLEVWRASLYMFEESNMLGVGREKFKSALYDLADRKLITPSIVELPHSHNGPLFQMALWGIGGLIALLLVYFVPFIYFCRELRHSDSQVRVPAAMGAVMCIGFFIFDMTDVMFFWVILNGFYVINLAIFMSCILKRKQEFELEKNNK